MQTLFQILLKLAQLALILPLQTADVEHGFSAQNLTKNAHRNRMEAETFFLFQALSTCLNSFVIQALNGCTSLDPKTVRNVYHHHQSVSDMYTTFAELINKNIKKHIHVEIWQLETLFWLLLRAPAGIPGHSKEFFKSFWTRGIMFTESKSTSSLQFSSILWTSYSNWSRNENPFSIE